jgi:hypothetical protein
MTSANARQQIASAIPFISGNISFLVRTVPVVVFLCQFAPLVPTQRADGWHGHAVNYTGMAVWGLTILGIGVGVLLSSSPRLYGFEKDGRLYETLGVRQFRCFVTNGDWMVKLTNTISPNSYERLGQASLAGRRAFHREIERLHWALLAGTLPAFMWAVILGHAGYALIFFVLVAIGDLYPIMFQRYSLAVLSRIESRARSTHQANRQGRISLS